ncbi:hypothetical protein [Streptomyces gibsoniae]|uniref:Tetratricopeptide repeat protein n=1 Tax=Streptomyces gibsoniae TaxID=3075529 RepID=A0ABU2U2S5_9ACTN|nr:hypothetical protein [Streptomyces sp. DSM 41699]MDT0467516.1 hypothetical protein [Streptomyces sp. DSM 41699]
MSIEAMLRRDAQALTRGATSAERQKLRNDLLPAGQAPESTAEGWVGSLAAAGSAPGRGLSAAQEAQALAAGDHTVLDRYLREGSQGHATSARRAAELLEAIGDNESARSWWRTAARLGDEDALDYVEAFLFDHILDERR